MPSSNLARRPRRLRICRPDLPCARCFRPCRALNSAPSRVRSRTRCMRTGPGVDVVPDVAGAVAPNRHRPGRGRDAQCPAPSGGQGGAGSRQACGGRQALHAGRCPGARTGRLWPSGNGRLLVGLPEPPFRLRLPDPARPVSRAANWAARCTSNRISTAIRPAGARALARAAGAGCRPVGRSGLAPGRPGGPAVRPARHPATRHRRVARRRAWSKTTSTPCCATKPARTRRLRVVLHATTLAAHAAPRYIVHGTRGSYVKRGVDPQEDALRAGGRPGEARLGCRSGRRRTHDRRRSTAGCRRSTRAHAAGNYVELLRGGARCDPGQGPESGDAGAGGRAHGTARPGRQSAAEGRALAAR